MEVGDMMINFGNMPIDFEYLIKDFHRSISGVCWKLTRKSFKATQGDNIATAYGICFDHLGDYIHGQYSSKEKMRIGEFSPLKILLKRQMIT